MTKHCCQLWCIWLTHEILVFHQSWFLLTVCVFQAPETITSRYMTTCVDDENLTLLHIMMPLWWSSPCFTRSEPQTSLGPIQPTNRTNFWFSRFAMTCVWLRSGKQDWTTIIPSVATKIIVVITVNSVLCIRRDSRSENTHINRF